MTKMTRRVHRVPLGPFVVLSLLPILSNAESTLTSITSKLTSTSTTIPSSTKSTTTASSTVTGTPVATAAAAEEPANMLVTVSYIGIAVGCSVLAIFALTIFFSYRQKKARSEQPPMSDAKKEYIEYFKNQNNGNGQGGAGQGAGNNGPWANSDAKDNDKTTHARSGSKSSLARFHFRSSSKSQEPAMEPILKIEVTSNPSLRPVSTMPKFEVPGKVIYEDPRSVPVPPHAMTTSGNEGPYKFPPRTTSRRAPPMPLAIRPFAPSSVVGTPTTIAIQSPQSFTAVGLSPTPRRNEVQPLRTKGSSNQSQLSPIQMQPIRPYSPLESASGRNNEPQAYIPSWMNMPHQQPRHDREPRSITSQKPQKSIPRELRPMSSTTIASDGSRRFSDDMYSSYDEDDYSDDEDKNYNYRSQVYDSYRRSTDSYYDDRRPLSARSYESGWSYGPSHSSRERAQAPRSHAEPYNSSGLSARGGSGSNGRQKTPVPVNAKSTLSPTSYINNKGGREAAKVSPVTPPPAPPKDWEVVAIKMDPYPPFEATIRASPAPASRGNTPRPILKNGGLPNNPKTKQQAAWERDLERGYY
ncbi:hypothetical protein TWF718_000567 [Orbilia javanica]|uniref:Uncharacterized protein n=1 Tax=Orbilia javanica TaxID=47235 RepID=A0AAN8MZI6_9PEZI